MTHDILQTDIDLATRLWAEQRPDEEIIRALTQRGVDRAKAAELLDDLRNGRTASARLPLPPEFSPPRRSRSSSASRRSGQSPPTRSLKPASGGEASSRAAARRRRKPAVVWVATASLLLLILVVVGGVLFQRHHAGTNAREGQPPKAANAELDQSGQRAPAAVNGATGDGSPRR